MSKRTRRSQAVGYKNPPRSTQFKPGQSGNPRGRPKATMDFFDAVERELQRRTGITEEGKGKRITKKDLSAKQLVNGAARGDIKSIAFIFKMASMKKQEEEFEKPDEPGPDDHLVMANIIRRIRLADAPAAEADNAGDGALPDTPQADKKEKGEGV